MTDDAEYFHICLVTNHTAALDTFIPTLYSISIYLYIIFVTRIYNYLLLLYKNTIEFYILTLNPMTLLNSLLSWNSCLIPVISM